MPDPVIISASGLSLDISAPEGVVVVRCRGNLMLENSDFLKREIKSRIPPKGCMVLDLSDVSRMDSSGLGAIVGLYLSARGKSCTLELINLNQRVRELFAMSNLLSIFETCGRQGIRIP
jgi:anti-sigma B factor antagonist